MVMATVPPASSNQLASPLSTHKAVISSQEHDQDCVQKKKNIYILHTFSALEISSSGRLKPTCDTCIIGERARHSQVCSIKNRDIYIAIYIVRTYVTFAI